MKSLLFILTCIFLFFEVIPLTVRQNGRLAPLPRDWSNGYVVIKSGIHLGLTEKNTTLVRCFAKMDDGQWTEAMDNGRLRPRNGRKEWTELYRQRQMDRRNGHFGLKFFTLKA